MEINIPKKVKIEIDVDIEKEMNKKDNKKEIEARRKIFSGGNFKW